MIMSIFNFRGVQIEISQEDVRRFRNLVEFDLSEAVAETAQKDQKLVKSFKLFTLASVIIRRGLDGLRVNPTRDQDAIWHLTLKISRLYRMYSYAVAGFYIQHDPTMPPKELVRLSDIEYGQLAQFFYNLAPDLTGYFNECLEIGYCSEEHYDNPNAWQFRQEFEDIAGIATVHGALHDDYIPYDLSADADISEVEDCLTIRGEQIPITHDDVEHYRALVGFNIQIFLARLPHENRKQQLEAFKLFFLAHVIMRKKGLFVTPNQLPAKVWDLSLIYTVVYDQFSHAAVGYFVDSLHGVAEEKKIVLTSEEYDLIAKVFYLIAPETDGFFSEALKLGYLSEPKALVTT